ncbi:hypothetical protein FO519_006605 [Halicephalobus sp. NKZ332]|nr:hypothetical protein FO519_006605 [Halicephalobus sp. NKZ332]
MIGAARMFFENGNTFVSFAVGNVPNSKVKNTPPVRNCIIMRGICNNTCQIMSRVISSTMVNVSNISHMPKNECSRDKVKHAELYNSAELIKICTDAELIKICTNAGLTDACNHTEPTGVDDDAELRKIFWLKILHKAAIFIISTKSIIKIIIETFYINFAGLLMLLYAFYFIGISAICGISGYLSSKNNIDEWIISSITRGIVVFLGRAIFLLFVIDLDSLIRRRRRRNNILLPMNPNLCKFITFVLWIISSYWAYNFISTGNLNEDISSQIISADIIFSLFLATAYTTKYNNKDSIMNILILIAKKRYVMKSPMSVLMLILSALVTLGGFIYTGWVYFYEVEASDSEFFCPGLFTTLTMLTNTICAVYVYYFTEPESIDNSVNRGQVEFEAVEQGVALLEITPHL